MPSSLYQRQIFPHGKIDSDKEYLRKVYAMAYDSVNGVMLTRNPKKLNTISINELKNKFAHMKDIAKRRCPHLLAEIQEIERLSLLNAAGRISDRVYLRSIRIYCDRHGLNPHQINLVERNIDRAEYEARLKKLPRPTLIKSPKIMIPKIKYPKIQRPTARYPKMSKIKPMNIPRIKLKKIRPWPTRRKPPALLPPPKSRRRRI